jgi:succinate dehydrogenase / fumarate reductase flavoprotein subunit
MKIFPAVHYSMGGAWVDWPAADDPDRWNRYRQMTNLPGCFNVGESDYQYHGANRLGANSLLSCIFGGLVTGNEIPRYIDNLSSSYHQTPEAVYEKALAAEKQFKQELLSRQGPENVHLLHDELAKFMVSYVTVKRSNEGLQLTLDKIKELKDRYKQITVGDKGQFANQTYAFANQFRAMLDIAQVIALSALRRDEFRGAHYKAGYDKRDDEHWLKTTIATYNTATDSPEISYEPVDTRYLKPILRDYSHAKKVKPKLENVPANIPLPI